MLIDNAINIWLKPKGVRYSVHTAQSPAHPEQPGPVAHVSLRRWLRFPLTCEHSTRP